MKYCVKCGTANDDSSGFCSNCAASLSAQQSQVPPQAPVSADDAWKKEAHKGKLSIVKVWSIILIVLNSITILFGLLALQLVDAAKALGASSAELSTYNSYLVFELVSSIGLFVCAIICLVFNGKAKGNNGAPLDVKKSASKALMILSIIMLVLMVGKLVETFMFLGYVNKSSYFTLGASNYSNIVFSIAYVAITALMLFNVIRYKKSLNN